MYHRAFNFVGVIDRRNQGFHFDSETSYICRWPFDCFSKSNIVFLKRKYLVNSYYVHMSSKQANCFIQQLVRYCIPIQMHIALLNMFISFRSSFCYHLPSFVLKFWLQYDFSNKSLIPARRIKP